MFLGLLLSLCPLFQEGPRVEGRKGPPSPPLRPILELLPLTLASLRTRGLAFVCACCLTSGWDSQKDQGQYTRPFCAPCPTLPKLPLPPPRCSPPGRPRSAAPGPEWNWSCPFLHGQSHSRWLILSRSDFPLTWGFGSCWSLGSGGRTGLASVEGDFRWPFSVTAADTPWPFSQPRPGTAL